MAHIIQSVPPSNLQQVLESFSLPTAQRLHEIGLAGKPQSEQVLVPLVKEIQDLLDQISVFVKVVSPEVGQNEPHPVVEFLTKLWPLLSSLLEAFGSETRVCESISRILRHAMDSTKRHLMPLLPAILDTMIKGYETFGTSSFLWMAKKVVEIYGQDNDSGHEMTVIIEKMTTTTMHNLRKCSKIDDIPDGMMSIT